MSARWWPVFLSASAFDIALWYLTDFDILLLFAGYFIGRAVSMLSEAAK